MSFLIYECDNQNDKYKNPTNSQKNANIITNNSKKYNENISVIRQSNTQEKRGNSLSFNNYIKIF